MTAAVTGFQVSASRPISGVRWRATAADDLSWIDRGDGYVAYHRPSGKTHFLNDASHALLTEILVEPQEVADVVAALAAGSAAASPPPDAEVAQELEAMLTRFEQLGLVHRE